MSHRKPSDADVEAQLRALREIRNFKPTPEEERILDEFEEFRRQHQTNFSSFAKEEIEELVRAEEETTSDSEAEAGD